MNNKNLTLIALAVAALVLVPKIANAQAIKKPAGSASKPIVNKNVNDDMWARLLGNGWKNIREAQNDDGTRAFLKKNAAGQIVTSDGKPVNTSDPVIDYLQTNLGFTEEQVSYENSFFATKAMTGRDVTDPMDGFRNPQAYW